MNNNNINNEYNIKLYNSVFNNLYLKKIIFNHLTIYNILNNNIQFKSHEQWEQFKYKEYLYNITLDYDDDEDLSRLPENIKHIQLVRINNLNSIPNHVESIKLLKKFNSFDKSKLSTINSAVLSKVISFYIELKGIKDQIGVNKILPSVTDLKIESQNIIELKKRMLPNNLKFIRLNKVTSLENGCLFESLSSASLCACSPSIINQMLSNNLIKLEFSCNLEKIINKFDNSIIFPESLQELTIQCYSFSSKLPSNLKKLSLRVFKFEDTIIFPSSLEDIGISIEKDYKKEVFNNKESVPCNLKSLAFSRSSIVDNNGQSILPNKLENLSFVCYPGISFNQVLQVDQLPSSLTYLDLGFSFNQVIEVNVLPSSLKKLILGYIYTQIINPLAIPQQLELLIILNQDYNHPINLPVSTHPNTLIKCKNLNLYYNPSNTSIRELRLPDQFNSSLSRLKLQDKSSLEYLHLGSRFNQPIELSDLPIKNNIKKLELGYLFNQTINLEYFQNLETIILPQYSNYATITISSTITNQEEIIYNNYSLKNILVLPNNSQFIINLNRNFYKFIKLNQIK